MASFNILKSEPIEDGVAIGLRIADKEGKLHEVTINVMVGHPLVDDIEEYNDEKTGKIKTRVIGKKKDPSFNFNTVLQAQIEKAVLEKVAEFDKESDEE